MQVVVVVVVVARAVGESVTLLSLWQTDLKGEGDPLSTQSNFTPVASSLAEGCV